MSLVQTALGSIGQVLLAGVVFGAGLPAVFALGVRALTAGAGPAGGTDVADGATARSAGPLGRVVAAACFAVVLAAVAVGIAIVVAKGFGATLTFEHGFPAFSHGK